MMNKDDFIKELSRTEKITLGDAGKYVDAVLKGIMRATKNKGGVKFVGFGNFENKKTKERIGRNPQTGEALSIPANRKPIFNPGSVFEDMIKDSKAKSTVIVSVVPEVEASAEVHDAAPAAAPKAPRTAPKPAGVASGE